MVHDGGPLGREESVSPAAAAESAMLTSFIDAHEQRDLMTAAVPFAFAQARLPMGNDKSEES